MKFLLLIHGDPAAQPAPGTPESQAEMSAYGEYTGRLAGAGALQDAQVLLPAQTATTVTVRNGDARHAPGAVHGGPSSLGGYYLIDVPQLDDALSWAAQIPGALTGKVEVRPVLDLAAAGQGGAS